MSDVYTNKAKIVAVVLDANEPFSINNCLKVQAFFDENTYPSFNINGQTVFMPSTISYAEFYFGGSQNLFDFSIEDSGLGEVSLVIQLA